ncbi:MAG: ATP-binding protein [Gammaproteobacteria bacterium]|nr:ATP-binding protein [Gammaproteobacteria bacterium]
MGFFAAGMVIYRQHILLRKNELLIANAEAEWTQAMDSLDYPMYLVNLDDNLVRANKAFYRQIGKPAEDCVGTDVRKLIHLKGEDQPCPGCLARLERRDAFFTKEADDPHNALGKPIEVTIKVVRAENNEPIGIVQSIRDVSHLKETENALRKSQALLKEAQHIGHMGNWEWDIKTNALKWSDETYQIFGIDKKTANTTYEQFIDRIHPDDRRAVNQAISKAINNKEPYQTEHRTLLPNGDERIISERGRVFYNDNGDPVRLVGVCQDITDFRHAEALLKVHKENLEELIRQRTLELANARDDAQQANRAKSAFLATMSHELRTPLNAIIGYSEILLEDAQNIEQVDQNELCYDLEKIRQSGKYLLTLVSDILDLSKIEADKLELHITTINVPQFIDDLTAIVEPGIWKNNNEFIVQMTTGIGEIQGDILRIRQMLINLLCNAGKFTCNGVVTLNIAHDIDGNQNSEWIEFTVADTGIGIPGQDVDRLFKPFSQSRSTVVAGNEGAGLGLAITKRLCDMMGGTIAVNSTQGEGTAFVVRIPAEFEHRHDSGVTPGTAKNVA